MSTKQEQLIKHVAMMQPDELKVLDKLIDLVQSGQQDLAREVIRTAREQTSDSRN